MTRPRWAAPASRKRWMIRATRSTFASRKASSGVQPANGLSSAASPGRMPYCCNSPWVCVKIEVHHVFFRRPGSRIALRPTPATGCLFRTSCEVSAWPRLIRKGECHETQQALFQNPAARRPVRGDVRCRHRHFGRADDNLTGIVQLVRHLFPDVHRPLLFGGMRRSMHRVLCDLQASERLQLSLCCRIAEAHFHSGSGCEPGVREVDTREGAAHAFLKMPAPARGQETGPQPSPDSSASGGA